MTLAWRNARTECEVRIGVLFSFRATDTQFFSYVAESVLSASPETLTMRLMSASGSMQLGRTGCPLSKYGVRSGAQVQVQEWSFSPTGPYEEEKNSPFLTDEEMLRQAIANSLEDMAHTAHREVGVEDEKAWLEDVVPPIQIGPEVPAEAPAGDNDAAGGDDNKPKTPKTPSTGKDREDNRAKENRHRRGSAKGFNRLPGRMFN